MAKNKEFDINKYSNAKILSPKKYKVWLQQVKAKDNNEAEMQQLIERLENDRTNAEVNRNKLFKKWWLKELISAVAIVGLALLGNIFTGFSPFSFLITGIVFGAVVNVVALTVIPAIRLSRNPYKKLLSLEDELKNQKKSTKVKANVKEYTSSKEESKNLVDSQVRIDSEEEVYRLREDDALANSNNNKLNEEKENIVSQPNPNTVGVGPNNNIKTDEQNSEEDKNNNKNEDIKEEDNLEEKELVEIENEKSFPRYVFKAAIRTTTADGYCPKDDVFVNISTIYLDKFIEKLSDKKFAQKDLENFSRARKTKKAKYMANTASRALKSIEQDYKNGEITEKQANKEKSKIVSVALVFQITNMNNPEKGTVESRAFEVTEDKEFFQIMEQVKNRVLQQATELKERAEQEEQTM